MKFQFNKTELHGLRKQLHARFIALPTLKNKEAALRAEIVKYKVQREETKLELENAHQKITHLKRLYVEFPLNLVKIKEVVIKAKKIAGVNIPIFKDASLEVRSFSLFSSPTWFLAGVEILENLTELEIQLQVQTMAIKILERARRKTTQKVNLYEKVQIPAYQDSILKIKRYLEDVENLDKVGSKIVKKRLAAL